MSKTLMPEFSLLRTNGPPVLIMSSNWNQTFHGVREYDAMTIQLSVWEGRELYLNTSFAYLSMVCGNELIFGQIIDLAAHSIERLIGACMELYPPMGLSRIELRRSLQTLAGDYYRTLAPNLPVLERPERPCAPLTSEQVLSTREGWVVFNRDWPEKPVAFAIAGVLYDANGSYLPGATHPMHVAAPGWVLVLRDQWENHRSAKDASTR